MHKEISPYTEEQTKIIEIFSDAFSESNALSEKRAKLDSVEIAEDIGTKRDFILTKVHAGSDLDRLDPVFLGELAVFKAGYFIPIEIVDLDIPPADRS